MRSSFTCLYTYIYVQTIAARPILRESVAAAAAARSGYNADHDIAKYTLSALAQGSGSLREFRAFTSPPPPPSSYTAYFLYIYIYIHTGRRCVIDVVLFTAYIYIGSPLPSNKFFSKAARLLNRVIETARRQVS